MNHERVQIFREKLDNCTISDYHGLRSPGLTCYLNSILQVLFMTEGFREEIRRRRSNGAGAIDAHLDSLFADLMMRQARTHSLIEQLGITDLYEQRDAAEYFENILRLSSLEASKIFRGQLSHKARCLHCDKEHDSRSNFWILPLVVEDLHHQAYSVKEGFQAFFKSDTVCEDNVMFCNRCCEKRDAELGCEITHAPEVLTLLLKRFSYSKRQRCYVKLHCRVHVPKSLRVQSYMYKLYALVHHYGDLTGGHYTAEIRSFETGKWYHFNDDLVQMVQPGKDHMRSRTAYLLMYRQGKLRSDQTDGCNQEAGAELEVEAGGREGRERREEPVRRHQMNSDVLGRRRDDAVKQKLSAGELGNHRKQTVTWEKPLREPEDIKALRLECNTLTDEGHNKARMQQRDTDSKMRRCDPNTQERPHVRAKTVSSSAGGVVSPVRAKGVKFKRDAGGERSREGKMKVEKIFGDCVDNAALGWVSTNGCSFLSPSLSHSRKNKFTAHHPVSAHISTLEASKREKMGN